MKVRIRIAAGAAAVVAMGGVAGGIALSPSADEIKPAAASSAAPNGSAGGAATAQKEPNRYTILKTMPATGKNRAARSVPLRRGYYRRGTDKGFGYAKAALKHGFTKTSYISKMTKVASWQHESGTSYNLTITVREWTCDSKGACKIKRKQRVLQVVNLRNARGKPLGLVTMYCPGTGVHCPSWVMKTFECPKIEHGVPCSARSAPSRGGARAVPAPATRYDMVPGAA
ncbi:hypothetical protein GWI34_18100 [Actinomadura sp. DSM 109109]|nr:hypothetical protein [Actinomadura lepetitiana]